MTTMLKTLAAVTMWLVAAVAPSAAVTVPFTEDFVSDTANWKDVASLDLAQVGSGGPDGGGYVTTEFAFTNANPQTGSSVLFRGQDLFNSSGDAFVGNWLTAGVRQLSAYVRHDAPEPVDFFARLATPANFPGVIFGASALVQPNTWTRLEFPISQTNPLVTVEGPPGNYNAALSNIGNLQIGARVPAALAADQTAYTFDLDKAFIVPEPSSILLLLAAAAIGLGPAIRSR